MARAVNSAPGWRVRIMHWLWPLLLVASAAVAGPSASARTHLAAGYLIAAQQESGFFRYEYNFLSGRSSRKNNIVRQAGAAFSLAEYYLRFPDASVKSAVEAALRAFDQSSIPWKRGRLLSLDGTPGKAKAGATALALLASLLISSPDSATEARQREERWLRGLLALQLPEGGFSNRPGSTRESPYSNGEIWLALAHYRLLHPGNAAVERALALADRRFIEHYGKAPNVGFFHWGVMAAAKRDQNSADHRFADFIAQQTAHYIDHLRPNINPRSNSCYAVEGLVAGADLLGRFDRYRTLHQRVRERIAGEMEKNRRLQIVPDQEKLHFSEQRYLVAPEVADHAGAFLNGLYRPQVRIDATQHCLSALLKVIAEPGAASHGYNPER